MTRKAKTAPLEAAPPPAVITPELCSPEAIDQTWSLAQQEDHAAQGEADQAAGHEFERDQYDQTLSSLQKQQATLQEQINEVTCKRDDADGKVRHHRAAEERHRRTARHHGTTALAQSAQMGIEPPGQRQAPVEAAATRAVAAAGVPRTAADLTAGSEAKLASVIAAHQEEGGPPNPVWDRPGGAIS